MRPQFFPWLFDDKDAWEKSFADPRYSYELPIDNFMALYQIERKSNGNEAAVPMFSAPAMPLPVAAAPAISPFAAMPLAAVPVTPVVAAKEEPKQDGILSQDEIDALLSGL
jgi:hypothetical protein